MSKEKIIGVEQALNLISDESKIAIASAGLVGYPDYIVKALEERFLNSGHPNNLTLYQGCGHAVPKRHEGAQRFGHKGFVKKMICSHPDQAPDLRCFIEDGTIQAYCIPQGVLQHLYRCAASREPGLLTKIGIGTYCDPRLEGGKLNQNTTEDLVSVMDIDGEEYLFYRSFPVSVAIVRGTTADDFGNITIEKEALRLENLEIALAAKASGGIVIAQVERIAQNGTLKAKDVQIPGNLVDAVVVAENPELYHRQTEGTVYSPYMSGELRCPVDNAVQRSEKLSAQDVICRRAAFELYDGAIVNVGKSIGAGVGTVAAVEGIQDKITFTMELGVVGGIPQDVPDFAASVNPQAFLSHGAMFDYYHGGNLGITFLGAAQIDKEGNVNVSKFAGRAAGQGGFIDITQSAKKVVYTLYFKAKGLDVNVENGKVNIENEGAFPKFISEVEQITFNGKDAREKGQEVIIITERCVFKLVKEGVKLVEIAPGIDLKKDILDQMEFAPIVSDDLKEMDARIFRPGRMGCFDE